MQPITKYPKTFPYTNFAYNFFQTCTTDFRIQSLGRAKLLSTGQNKESNKFRARLNKLAITIPLAIFAIHFYLDLRQQRRLEIENKNELEEIEEIESE